jgi:hypothetical protein
MIAEYILSFDDLDAENGEYLGVLEIANTATPAIEIKGIAFSKVEALCFKDDLKYRIAAPILTPGKIYRRDEKTGEEYYVVITPETVERAFVKFMKDRAGKDVFNEEHDEAKRIPSYPLEMWLVDEPMGDRSYNTFGIEVPKGTWFGVQQFTDVEAYKKAVEEEQTGFSIHGDGALKLSKQFKTDKMKVQMKKHKYVAHFAESAETDGGEIIVTADVLEVGTEVVVVDDNLEEVADFSGDVIIDDVPVVIENDVITSMGEEVALEEEKKEEVQMKSKVKMKKHKFSARLSEVSEAEGGELIVSADEIAVGQEVVVIDDNLEEIADFSGEVIIEGETVEIVDDVIQAVDGTESVEMAEEGAAADTYTKTDIDAKFDEIYAILAELKLSDEKEEVEMMEDEPKDEVSLKMSRLDKVSKFLTKK